MKTYSIGRDLNCDIVINDTTDVISRRHALLNVTSSGKMTVIDQSSNGTYVNGIRISSNVPVPVTRKDTVSLAHVAKLDWNRVPRANGWLTYALIAVVSAALIAAFIWGIMRKRPLPRPDDTNLHGPEVVVDSAALKEKERTDSLEKALRDSIKVLEREKVEAKKKKTRPAREEGKEKEPPKQDDNKESEQTGTTQAIG